MATTHDGIYKRKDRQGYWIQWTDSTGKRHVKKAKGIYLAEARREKAALERGEGLPNRTPSFAAIAAQFLAYQQPRLTPAAYVREKGIIEKTLVPFYTGNIANITKADLSRFVSSRLAQVSAASVRKELTSLKHLFRLAVEEWNYIQASPAQGVKPPKKPADRVRFLHPGELATVLAACPGWLKPVVLLAVTTGMRRGEILGLRWLDVSFERGTILLPQTKNGDGRFVCLNQTALEALRSLPVSLDTKPTDRLFSEVTAAQVSQRFLRACRKAGIFDFHFHDLRHTHASWLRQRGTQLDVIAKQLGHRDLRMTARYAHLADTQVQQAVAALDTVFEGTRYPSATEQIPAREKIAVNA